MKKKTRRLLRWVAVLLAAALMVMVYLLSRITGDTSPAPAEQAETAPAVTAATDATDASEGITDCYIEIGSQPARAWEDTLFSAIDVLEEAVPGDILVTPEEFAAKAERKNGFGHGNRASAGMDRLRTAMNEIDILVLEFEACTEGPLAELTVHIGDKVNRVFVSGNPTTYFIPVSGMARLDSILFEITSDYVPMVIDRVYLVNYGHATTIDRLKAGTYANTPVPAEEILSDRLTEEHSSQCVVKDSFLYSIANDSLFVYRLDSPEGAAEKVAELSGLTVTRDMALCEEQNVLVITGRHNGAYIVDISDPCQPALLCRFDTLEGATGVDVCGSYAFLCSRYHGVEIVDISDPRNPVWINTVAGDAEYQDCFADGDTLYIGVYGEKRIDIYSIANLLNPRLLSRISLDGAGQGCFVRDGILYAATALNGSNTSSARTDYGAGTGNGLEIFDVSDPENPKRLSVFKIDGRFNASGGSFRGISWTDLSCDIWDVAVSGNYAYLSSMTNGLFIIDVSDPRAPVCLKNYQLPIALKEYGYNYLAVNLYNLNWDYPDTGRGCINHTAVADGKLYVAMVNQGVYCLDWAEAESIPARTAPEYESEQIAEQQIPRKYRAVTYETDGTVWAVAVDSDFIYTACGDAGIAVLDHTLQELERFPTQDSVRDVKLSGGYLYSAESVGGIGIYRADAGILTPVASLELPAPGYYASQLQLTDDGKFLFVMTSHGTYSVADVSDPAAPFWVDMTVERVGTMFYRGFSPNLVDGKYVMISGREKIAWYYSDNGELKLKNAVSNAYYRRDGGNAALGDRAVIVTNNGCLYLDPLIGLATRSYNFGKLNTRGKASCFGNRMVITNNSNGTVTILDVTDPENPYARDQFTVIGNPDIAYIDEEMILLPLRRRGLIKLTEHTTE